MGASEVGAPFLLPGSPERTEMVDIKSKRYPGLIKQAIETHGTAEEKGWKLAELLYEAAQELYNEGWPLFTTRNGKQVGAFVRVAGDLHMTVGTIEKYYRVWKKFSDPKKRDQTLTFYDHLSLIRNPKNADELRKKRAQQRSSPTGRRQRGTTPAVEPGAPYERLTTARSHLRRIAESDFTDYPDGEKMLAYLTDIQQIATDALIKLSGQKAAQSAVKVAA